MPANLRRRTRPPTRRVARSPLSGGTTRKWIMDIHNGISNPLFTYTGGQAIVPDEDGILRRTPAGYPAVEVGRWAATVAEGALLGPELVTVAADREFTSDTGWWLKSAAFTIGSGVLNVNASGWSTITRSGIVAVGKRYAVEFDIITKVSGTDLRIYAGDGVPAQPTTAPGHKSVTILCAAANLIFSIGTNDFVGTIDNVSVKEVIPQWYAPTLGATSNIRTRKGLRQIQTADTFEGMLVEPAMTNKCTCSKSNPTDLTNVTKSGDAASVLSVVNDAAALTAAGLGDICTSGMVYDLDNTLGVDMANVDIGGNTVNVNPHSASVYGRVVSGPEISNNVGYFNTGGSEFGKITGSSYTLIRGDNKIPTASTRLLIRAQAGARIRFILPQLEESAFCTSIIAPAADTAAAQTRQASVVSASTSGVFPSTGQDFAIFQRVVPGAAGQNSKYLFFAGQSVNDNFSILIFVATVTVAKWSGGVSTPLQNFSFTHQRDVPVDFLVIQSSQGVSIKKREYLAGAWTGWSAWLSKTDASGKAPAKTSGTYFISGHSSGYQFCGNNPRTAIIAMPPKATLAEYQTWIDEELTRRGLI